MIKIFFFISTIILNLYAHQTGLSYVNILENQKHIAVVYKKPLGDIQAKDLAIDFPAFCKQDTKRITSLEDGFIIFKYTMDCGKKSLENSRIWIEGLEPLNRGVLMYFKNEDLEKKMLIKANTPYMLIDKKSTTYSLVLEYIKLGIEHILTGYDHLLFVFSLLLIAKNMKVLIIAISAFTLSHSITLLSAVYGFIDIPILYVEAMIALSIVFLARELLIVNENSLTRKHLEYISFIFGLLHGFGFSNVLRSIGLPQEDMFLALFSFNLGIELGQLAFIFISSFILFFMKKRLQKYTSISLKISAYTIGALSFFWLLQRVILF